MKYINEITNEITLYPYRFKTEEEFIKVFGNTWTTDVSWGVPGMDYLFGMDFEYSTDKEIIQEEFKNTNNIFNDIEFINIPNSGWTACRLMLKQNKAKPVISTYTENPTNKLVYENRILKFNNFRK